MENMIENVQEFIKNMKPQDMFFIAVGIIAFIIVLIFIKGIRLKKYRKQIIALENQMNGTRSLPLQYRLGRVKSIAKNMPDVEPLYEEFNEEFEEIINFQKSELAVLMNEVDEQLFYGKLRKVSKKMKALSQMIDSYHQQSLDLLKKIEEVTEIENVQRVKIIKVKEKYRSLIDLFESLRFQVEEFIPGLVQYFNEMDDSFVYLETLMNNQEFETSQDITVKIDARIEWMNSYMADLPHFCTIINKFFPKKLDDIIQTLRMMDEKDYHLEHLGIENRYKTIKKSYDTSKKRLEELDFEPLGKELQAISDSIDSMVLDLQTEKESYDLFKDKWETCYTEITRIYDDYKQALLDYNQLKGLYVLDSESIEISDHYKEFRKLLDISYDLEDEMMKGQFSYSDINTRVDELLKQASEHDVYINAFIHTRNDLYLKEQRAIDELENINIVLLEIKSEIKNRHLPMIHESYKDYIQDSYDKAAQIQAYRNTRPVKLDELTDRVNEARDIIYKLYDNVHNLIVTAQMVEEAVVFGNRYRSMFLEVNTELTKAEVLFRNGEYTKALSTAVEIIEKIKPGSYEELVEKMV